MPSKVALRDIVIVLPGIGGTNLRYRGSPMWEPRPRMLRELLRDHRGVLDRLAGAAERLDDPEADLDVRPAGLVRTPVVLPGLSKLNPYHRLRRAIADRFDLVPGDPLVDGSPANYFEFGYDWRRDNRIAAAALRSLIRRERPKWEGTLPGGRSRVILIAHSMGGLVAKYYLDALGGWDTCRVLITFGTPYRGSVRALDYLANGYRKLGRELTSVSELLSGYTSVYQLLPRYPMVEDRRTGRPDAATTARVCDLDADMGRLKVARARAAYAFHTSMDPSNGVGPVVPVVGYGQRTAQSAVLDDGGLTVSEAPGALRFPRAWLGTGDRTVPVVSALPVGYPPGVMHAWANGSHATMHSMPAGLGLLGRALDMLSTGLEDFQSLYPAESAATDAMPAGAPVRVDIDDAYAVGEPVVARCLVEGAAETSPTVVLHGGALTAAGRTLATGDGNTYRTEGLAAGTYEITVTGAGQTVSDVFEVL